MNSAKRESKMEQARRKNRNGLGSIFTDALFGLVAGAVATFIMDKVSGYLYELEDEQTRRYEENLRGNEYPPEVLAEKISETVAGVELSKEQKQKYGNYVHWSYGIMWGGLYGALRGRVLLVDVADGVGFGTGLWLIGDEVMMPLMGLSPPSTEFPWQNHARSFANHAAYGATLGITHSLLRKLCG
ncbi:MAG: DUF1440 domain-containing protein [Acidobacteria bacterium]|nr:DUF1440 domain-containing protein [Acidobacteriota bacterium]